MLTSTLEEEEEEEEEGLFKADAVNEEDPERGVLGPNGVIYFVPLNAKNVGILDSASSSFTTLDISHVLGPTRRRDTLHPCTRPTVATHRWLQRTAYAGAPALLAAARPRRAALGVQNPLHVWISNLRLKRGTMENGEHRKKPKK